MNIITDIFQFMNEKAEAFFEWAQANPKFGLLIVAVLLAVWLTGLLFRWGWALHWQNYDKMWIFDDCKPETKRRIQILLVSVAIACCLVLVCIWK